MRSMFERFKSFGLVAVSAGLVAALLLGSVVPAKAAEERVVKVGLRAIFTGPLATFGTPVYTGLIDGARYVNEQRGINGIKISTPWYDTRAEIPRGIMAHKRLKEEGVVMEIDIVCGIIDTLAPAQQRDEIPLLGYQAYTSPGALTKPVPWIFLPVSEWENTMFDQLKALNASWGEERPLKFGMFIHDLPDARALVEGAKRYAPEIGIDFVGYEVIPFLGAIDTSVEWLRLMSKKPDWVYVMAFGSTFVTMAKDAARLEAREKGIKCMAGPFCADERTLKVTGKDTEGWYSVLLGPTNLETDVPGVRTVIEYAKRYRGYEPTDVPCTYLVASAVMKIAAGIIELAIEKVGFENLTGRAVRDVMGSGIIKDFDTDGMLPPVSMSDTQPWYVNKLRFCIIKEGRQVPWGPWFDVTAEHYPEWFQEALYK